MRSSRPLLFSLTLLQLLCGTVLIWTTAGKPSKNLHALQNSTPWIEQISWGPRAYVYHNFMSTEECDEVMNIARPMMKRSTVVGNNGSGVLNQIRTSYGTFIRRKRFPVIQNIEERLEKWTQLPLVHQEDMQILRYAEGQSYGAHYDSFEQSSPRLCTVLMYLKDEGLEGGETAFPVSEGWIGDSENRGPFSKCAAGHVAAKVKKGDALLFYNLNADGHPDELSLHTGCPVLAGVKWTATKWIHTQPFNPEWLNKTEPDPDILPEDCKDIDSNCKSWAEAGECSKNSGFMTGTSGTGLGHCRLSCKACEECSKRDRACLNRNRVKDGFLPLEVLD